LLDIDDCLTEPCSVSGTKRCRDLVNDFMCDCNFGFTGRHCKEGNVSFHNVVADLSISNSNES